MEEKILICEDSLEGVFTAVYEVYNRHIPRDTVRIQTREIENYRLFAEYIRIETDAARAVKVMRTLRTRFGEDTYKDLCMALTTADEDKAQAVYRTAVWGLEKCDSAKQGHVMDNLADPYVRKVMELSRRACNELHHLREFLRFQELRTGILFAKIGPRDNILPMLTPHFADRLPAEDFIIYDDKRDVAAVHPAMGEWYLVSGVREDMAKLEGGFSEKEEEYQELFRYFCHKISISERENLELQRNMLPIRFRKYMTEFIPK